MSSLAWLDSTLGELAERSLELLPEMYDAESGLYSHKTWVEDGAYRNREPNVLYSAVSLVGILRQGRRPAGQLGGAIDGLLRATAQRQRPGEIANAVWVCAMAEDERGRGLLRDLAAVDPRTCPSGELGQVLYGLVAGGRGFESERDAAAAAARVAATELLDRFSPAAEVFRGSPRGRRLPRRELLEAGLTSFAAQVYPLHGLAAHYLWTGEKPDPALAVVANRIVDAQGPLGQWWWLYSSRARTVIEGYPVYSVHQDGMAFLGLMELEKLDIGRFVEPLALGLKWLLGANELGVDLVERGPFLIDRCMMRAGSRADAAYGISPRNFRRVVRRSWMPKLAGDRTAATAEGLEVLRECRSYHLGWLLYADSLVQAAARADGGGS